jgi:hypothetical protein
MWTGTERVAHKNSELRVFYLEAEIQRARVGLGISILQMV